MSKETQIIHVLDANLLQEKANEYAQKGAIKEIEDFYTSYSSPYRKKIKEELEKKEISLGIELPDIIAVLNENLKNEIDLIANRAIAQTYIPLVHKFLTRIEKDIYFSDILKEFISATGASYYEAKIEIEESEEYKWLDVEISSKEKKYKFTLHDNHKGDGKYQIMRLPNTAYSKTSYSDSYSYSSKETMTLEIADVKLEMPFTKDILADDFMAYIAKVVIEAAKSQWTQSLLMKIGFTKIVVVNIFLLKLSLKNNMNSVQGDFALDLKFVDERVYLNYWKGNILCQIKEGKIFKFVYSTEEVEANELEDEPKIEDVFEQKEISLNDFLELVKQSSLTK